MPESQIDWDMDRLLAVVERRTGIHVREDQVGTLKITAERVMKRLGIRAPDNFLQAIQQDPHVYHEFVDEITIGETYFFREPKHFDFVAKTVIPEFREARGDSARLQAWSAACASGEEAYSLAILCEQLSQGVGIVASDLSPLALQKARRGRYRDWSFRGQAKSRVKNHITAVDDEYVLSDDIRRSVRFELMNLASETYPDVERGFADFDLIFCRNVLIYFGRETVDAIAKRLYRCLRPGGWLITASGDPSLMRVADFETLSTEFGTFYRRGKQDNKAALSSVLSPSVKSTAKAKSATAFVSQWPPAELTGPPADKTTISRVSEPKSKASSIEDSSDRVRWLVSAREAMRSKQYELAVRLTDDMMHHAEACVINVRAREAMRSECVLETSLGATVRHPLSHELHYLHARLLADVGRLDEAFQAVQKSLFLDRSSVIVHFLFGFIQRERGQLDSALRHFENTQELCSQLMPHQIVPMSDAETVAQIARAAESEIATLPPRRSCSD